MFSIAKVYKSIIAFQFHDLDIGTEPCRRDAVRDGEKLQLQVLFGAFQNLELEGLIPRVVG